MEILLNTSVNINLPFQLKKRFFNCRIFFEVRKLNGQYNNEKNKNKNKKIKKL